MNHTINTRWEALKVARASLPKDATTKQIYTLASTLLHEAPREEG